MRKLRIASLIAVFVGSLLIFVGASFSPALAGVNEDLAYEYLYEVMDRYHQSFDVYTDSDAGGNHYVPSGFMGNDEIDLTERWNGFAFAKTGTSCIRVDYPGSQDGWAGIYWQHPANNWGTVLGAGYDLTGATKLEFWAKGEVGGEIVEFYAGGITGPYGDSMPKVGILRELTSDWALYTIDVSGQGLSYIIGGFGLTVAHQYNPNGAVFYIDNIQYDLARLDDPRLLRSYETISIDPPDNVLTNAAYIYDNALAALAFLDRGTADDIRRSSLIVQAFVHVWGHDRYYAGGWLRNAYMCGDLFDGTDPDQTARLPGWTDEGDGWMEDPVQAGTYTGNVAWVILALLRYYETVDGDPVYLQTAEAMAQWIYDHNYSSVTSPADVGGFRGGYWGFEPDPTPQTYKATEHNIDLWVVFWKLHRLTGSPFWRDLALHARRFVQMMWDEETGRFWIGTTEDGQTIRDDPGVQPLDVNTWGLMALADKALMDYDRGIDWAEANCAATCDFEEHEFQGFDYNGDDQPGVWFEGTGQMVEAYRLLGQLSEAAFYLDEIREAQLYGPNGNGKGIIAACPDGIDTNLGWLYYSRLHVGATCWFTFAERGCNPLETANTVTAWLNCVPSAGTLPFTSTMTAVLANNIPGQSRRVTAQVNVNLANGAYFSNWRSGFTSIPAGSSFTTAWNQFLPALGALIGENYFTLVAADVTPSPYNQPPYPPSGDMHNDGCQLTAVGP